LSTTPKSTDGAKLAATLAELEAERQRRIQSGKWNRATAPMLIAIPEAGETLRAAQERALAEYLELHPDSQKSLHAYSWIEIEIVDPPPIIELPGMQYAPDHSDALDVTPPRHPPMPPPLPIEPPRNRALEARLAEERRMRRFMDDDWKPHDGPLRYPRGRNGW